MVSPRKSLNFWLILVPDIILLYASLFLSLRIRYGTAGFSPEVLTPHFNAFSIIFILWLVVFFSHGLFEAESLRRFAGLFFNLLSAMVVNIIIAITVFYLQPNLILRPGRFLLLQVGIAFVFLFAWHLLVKYIFKNRLIQGLYLFSFNNELLELEKEINSQPYLGFRVLGHLNQESLFEANFSKNDGLILPEDLQGSPEVLQKFYELRTLGVGFYNHKDFYEQLLRRVYLSQINELWFLENIDY